MKFIAWILGIWLLLPTGRGYGQTAEDLQLSYSGGLVENDILLCRDGEPPFRFQVKNETVSGKFKSFKLQLGDGSEPIDMVAPGSSKTIEYNERKKYDLKFIGVTNSGQEVVRSYAVKIIGRVRAVFAEVDDQAKCLDSDVKYTIVLESGDTEGARYFLNYDDGSEEVELDRSKFVNGRGVFVHQYKRSYCSMLDHERFFKVSLRYENECESFGGELATISEYVVEPFKAEYTFDRFDSKVCTYEKLDLRNITQGGIGSDCAMTDRIAFWDFGNGETSEDWEPYIKYDQKDVNPYSIKLVVRNNYACATDSVEHPVYLLKRTEAIMRPDKTELCVGEELLIENESWGDEVKSFWSVVSLDGFPVPDFVNTFHLKLKFDHWGKYKVTLTVTNECSSSQTDTTITVKQDPDLVRYDLPDGVCLPDALNTAFYVGVDWNGNAEGADWTITRRGGLKNADVEWLDGTDEHSAFPVFRFTQAGVYQVAVQLPDVGCGGTKLTGTREITVYDPAIAIAIDTTPLNICEGGVVGFTNTSIGDRLQYEWTVKPSAKVSFTHSTDPTSASPVIQFDKYGDYEVKLHMYTHSGCGVVDTVYRVHVRKDPAIIFFEPPQAVCPEPALFSLSGSVIYNFYNNPERVKWTITPDDGGWEFTDGDAGTPYPTLLFHKSGNYSFTVELESTGCPDNTASKLETRNIRVRNSAMTMEGIATDTLVCEGEALQFVLNAVTAEDDPVSFAWTVSPPDNTVDFGDYGNDKRIARLHFGHWGNYEVRGAAIGFCGTLDTTFRITVQKDPKVGLRQIDGVCIGEYDMRNYVTYQWFNNTPEVNWEVKNASGASGGFTIDNAHTEYPKITFDKPGDYSVRVSLVSHTQGCEEDSLQDIKTFHVYDPVISGDITRVGTGEICEGETVTFMNTTYVDGGLRWEWRVEGAEDGYAFQDEGKTSSAQLPVITFSKYGDYRVFAKAIGPCSEKEFPAFPVTVSGVPEVSIAAVLSVCEPFDFHGKEENRIVIDSHNDIIRAAQWTITANPDVVSGGYEYLGASAETSIYPDIRFRYGDYTVQVKYWNRCQEPGEATFRIQADEFIPIASVGHDSICTQSPEVRLLKAEPAYGIWSLKNADMPHAGEILYREGDAYYFNPKFGAYEELDVPLVYKLYNASCVDSAEVNMHVWALPHIDAGGIREMCLNHEPRLLIGKDSVAGAVWRSNRGEWYLDGQVLAEHRFRADKTGSFPIYYRYEDSHHCANADTTVMKVHALPDTSFVSRPQYCRGVLAEFTVDKSAEEWRYMWKYDADGQRDTLPGNGGFVYEQAGYHEVSMIAESVHGCLDTSAVHVIEVVGDAPQADFTMSTHSQCGPEVSVQLGVKEEDYADHNLHFEWTLGNGTTSGALLPDNPQVFYSALEDTVYHLKFRVYNICTETEKADSLRIGSLPQVHFQFENGGRNCSPLTLQVLNTSTGSNNQYLWYMGDGSEPLNVFEPLDYVYETDSARKVFHISLVATNQCGRDSIVQPLTVLAQSIRAFFSRPKEDICVGEQLCFTNHTRDTARDITYKYWDFGDGVRDTSWNACHVYRDSGRYKVLLYVDNGCSADTTSKFLNVIGNPKLDLLLEEARCDRDTFHFAFETDQPLQWVRWTLGDDSTVLLPAFSYVYETPGSYPVTLEVIGDNRAACRSERALVLTVHPRPVLHVTPLDTLVCPPYLYVPQVEGEAEKMMWDYGDGSPETSAGEHEYVNATDSLISYEVVLHAVSDKGCPEDYVGHIQVAYLPHAEVEKRVTTGRPQKVDLLNTSPEGYVDYIWVLPGEKEEHTTGDQHFEFMENGVYVFSLITENLYGCRDTATVEHEVMLKGLYFPNTFIPHSVNGRINRFNGIGMGLVRYKLEIFDRYGNKIWETVELEDGKPVGGWDGCNRKGERLPQGVYIWRAEAIFGNDDVWTGKNNDSGNPETTQGTVLLLRE